MTFTIIFLALVLILIGWRYVSLKGAHEDLKKKHEQDKKLTLENSRNSLRGQITEEFAPLLGNFPYELSDCKFSGAPIDYIVFDGMSKLRDTGEGEITIIISDVKVNNARLSKVQKAIKDAIENCRFRFEKWEIKDSKLTIK